MVFCPTHRLGTKAPNFYKSSHYSRKLENANIIVRHSGFVGSFINDRIKMHAKVKQSNGSDSFRISALELEIYSYSLTRGIYGLRITILISSRVTPILVFSAELNVHKLDYFFLSRFH